MGHFPFAALSVTSPPYHGPSGEALPLRLTLSLSMTRIVAWLPQRVHLAPEWGGWVFLPTEEMGNVLLPNGKCFVGSVEPSLLLTLFTQKKTEAAFPAPG